MSKQVENYFINKYESGIILLLINTKDRWVYFHRYDDNTYQIGGTENRGQKKYHFEFDESLISSLKDDKMYLCTQLQEKDQIMFYFIPFKLINKRKT